jgi:hypothetical protein
MGESEFRASNKWLISFRKTNQIALERVYGETGDVCEAMTEDLVCPAASNRMKQTLSATEKTAVPYKAPSWSGYTVFQYQVSNIK